MKKPKFTCVIIGGGLAGLVSAIHLARSGISVLLIEKKEFPRHKVCGEYVSNEIRPYLESLDAFPKELKPLEINRFQITSLSGKKLEALMEMGGFGISRFAFDDFLDKKAKAAGAEIWTNGTVSSIDFKGFFFLRFL